MSAPTTDPVESLLACQSAQEIKAYCERELKSCQAALDAVLAAGEHLPGEDAEPESAGVATEFLDRSNALDSLLGNLIQLLNLMRSVHPTPDVRTALEEAEQEAARFAHELNLHRGLYEAVSRCPLDGLEPEAKRLVERLLRDFRRAGVDRDESTRERIRNLQQELVALGQEFTRNILNDVRAIELDSVDDLKGLPEDYIRDHQPGANGKVRITTEYPDYNPFMTYAANGELRRKLYSEFRCRAYPDNVATLEKMLRARHQLATLLGYSSWAAYASEDKMIKTATAIGEFIDRVAEAAHERAQQDYTVLLEYKRKEDPDAASVGDWEKTYYEELAKADRFKVDSKKIRAYFEYTRVRDGILTLTAELFGVRFERVADAPRWHADVEVYDVYENGQSLGRAYLDMHPRDGKFKHAAMFPMVSGVKGQAVPQAALVCNFPNPSSSSGAALLEHDDIITFLHEFGHLLHHLLGGAQRWVRFSGTATEWDFVEVPSQLYEEWAWDYDVLRRFAKHSETGAEIPEDLVERMNAARVFGVGQRVRHQMFLAAVSLQCYLRKPEDIDTTALVKELQTKYSMFSFVDGTFFQASFGHLDDYSALYYTYMWSLVIEKDLFGQFKHGGALSREVSRRYRETILAPGGSRDAVDLIEGFLGREYSFTAFEEWLGSAG